MKNPPAGCGQATLDKRDLVMRCDGRPAPHAVWGWVCDRCGLSLPQKPAPAPVPVPVAPGQLSLLDPPLPPPGQLSLRP